MRVRRSLASPGLLKFLAHPTLGPPIAKAFSAESRSHDGSEFIPFISPSR